MFRFLILAASAAALFGTISASNGVANRFIVTWSVIPDPLHAFSFYDMPRDRIESAHMGFDTKKVNNEDNTFVLCRGDDYRVCVLMDREGSVAGLQVSATVDEIRNSKTPMDLENNDYWFRQFFMGREVYSLVTYFVSKETLDKGGRFALQKSDPTAPEGIFVRSKSQGRIRVPLEQSRAEEAGFYKQACFRGMGTHYFQGLNKQSKCENHKPFFTLYNPKTEIMHGFGIAQFGKVSSGRGWFEHPPAPVVGMIAPNAPSCLKEWTTKHGLFTLHVFFVDNPWDTRC